jgi:CheY-like chemotaxis protein
MIMILQGLGATWHIRELEEDMKLDYPTPIIAVTAEKAEGQGPICTAAGCDYLQPKPLSKDMIFEIVGRFLIE